MLEILILLLISVTIHFLILVFHNKQKFNGKTFFKASLRILGFSICLIAILFAVKPLLDTVFDELLIIVLFGYIVFLGLYLNDYKNE
ncbi:hypothetical protein [Thalassotalea sp. PP2-459]|uniref:hypothetical protein n=1 Tax=Thalassotalea sp. PP2-459 TaxID=1742724 RepID=UPI00094366AF|nr:hypothetical protein [Thalassotalea sp. PP2-459]OKY25047.1 hypothetical protein BI291_17225 [Thalassotalea sp. PP2-459]